MKIDTRKAYLLVTYVNMFPKGLVIIFIRV